MFQLLSPGSLGREDIMTKPKAGSPTPMKTVKVGHFQGTLRCCLLPPSIEVYCCLPIFGGSRTARSPHRMKCCGDNMSFRLLSLAFFGLLNPIQRFL